MAEVRSGEVYFDGGARPTNPGHAGFGVLLVTEWTEVEIGRYAGWKTNNEAEYMGLIVGLKLALDHGIEDLVVTGDSLLVLNTVQGEWKCKKAHLKPLCEEAKTLASKFMRVKWVHVRGHQGHVENERVDTLCSNAINHHLNCNPWRRKMIEGAKLVDPFA